MKFFKINECGNPVCLPILQYNFILFHILIFIAIQVCSHFTPNILRFNGPHISLIHGIRVQIAGVSRAGS